MFLEPGYQLQAQGLFHVIVAVDGRGNGGFDLLIDLRIARHLHDRLLVLRRDLYLLELLVLHLHRDTLMEEIEVGALSLLGIGPLIGL